ncbi:flagellar protein FlgN [Lacrimispora saccharolytica]|uniref:flagellar protein FlgN n=1 Tax=Lacrimispora saccharolytica TaxID=84030 RepID=UPI001B702EFE|nr:flagellar protein FlgN [Lacrimispora saccharolytica]MBP9001665.1 flagellar protein FlgN [Lachnospiraceae bacterium]MCF2656904.1 flagellar protein FlgN [Lacrimispora saccharolytica]
MEDLISILEQEDSLYEDLLKLSMSKTPVLISGDLEALSRITEDEQEIVNKVNALDKKREEGMKDIANVLGKDVKTLKLTDLIDVLRSRPAEQNRLAAIYDKLSDTIGQMKRTNEQNKELIESSLEMVQFDMNVLQAYKAAPETANYSRNALNSGAYMGNMKGGFDAKQ